ncbi:MAG TPA: TRAP transporter substrate-binding protein [Stellaceae bacterium]|nr:TRAP transporter substrate-binding protein [Stellaceae bacterium]
MRFKLLCCCAISVAAAFSFAVCARADEPIVMKISLPTINDGPHIFSKNLAARIEKDSGGRIKAEVYPASQLGSIPRQIEGVQFGSIQCVVVPPEFMVGVDDRFQLMAAPGLVGSMPQAQHVAADPEVQKLILGLGANKGLHGAGLFAVVPSSIDFRTPVRHLAEFKGKKIRIFASDFQKVAFERLGATPVAMSLGDVLPALQQGAIDGAVAAMPVFTNFQYQDAAKYVTETGQPFIFITAEISEKWRATLPADLQQMIDHAAVEEAVAINGVTAKLLSDAEKDWVARGGERIQLPPDEQSSMMESFGSVAEDVASKDPKLAAAYKILADAAKRDK